MSNGTNDRDTLKSFHEEQNYVDEEMGACVGAALVHHANTGPVTVHLLTSARGAPFGDSAAMADLFDSLARRHALGIAGAGGSAQQFELQILRANSKGKPTARLPFVRMSAPSITGPTGSLSSEAPNGQGLTSQGMRLTELIVQGTNVERQQIVQLFGTLLQSERTHNLGIMAENRECMGLLRAFIADSMNNKASMLAYQRNTALILKGVDALPLALNQLTGKQILPESMEEDSMCDILLDTMTSEQIVEHLHVIEARSPTRAGLLASKLVQARKRRAARAAALRDVDAGGGDPSVEDDLIDRGVSAVRGKPAAEKTNGANGETRGTTNGEAAPASNEPEMNDAAIDKRHAHGLSKSDARRFVEGMAESLREQVPATWAWVGDRLVLRAEGQAKGITAVIDVDDAQVRIRVGLPGLAKLFRAAIEEQIDAALERLDARAKRQTAATANGGAQ